MNYLNPKDAKAMQPVAPEARPAAPVVPAVKAPAEIVTTLGHGVLITGNIVSAGAIQIHGRVTGEIHATHVIVSEGAKVEGKLTAQEAVIHGAFKGTLHGTTVKLQGTAVVEGEIFNRSLTIEQNALFEGASRRLEKPVVAPTMEQVTGGDAPSTAPIAPLAPVANVSYRGAQVGMDNELFA